jgi:hypothetical protein
MAGHNQSPLGSLASTSAICQLRAFPKTGTLTITNLAIGDIMLAASGNAGAPHRVDDMSTGDVTACRTVSHWDLSSTGTCAITARLRQIDGVAVIDLLGRDTGCLCRQSWDNVKTVGIDERVRGIRRRPIEATSAESAHLDFMDPILLAQTPGKVVFEDLAILQKIQWQYQ